MFLYSQYALGKDGDAGLSESSSSRTGFAAPPQISLIEQPLPAYPTTCQNKV